MSRFFTSFISQVDYIGHLILSKLMKDWRLMDELGVLRAIYLLGSGIFLHVECLISGLCQSLI